MIKSTSYKWEMLALLWFAFLFNQADRAMFGFIMPLLKTDMGLNDVELGLVATSFHVCYGLLAPVAGFVGDVVRRHKIIIWSITIWSLATVLTGFSNGLLALILFRGISLALGEAFYLPSANALIARFHEKTRAFAMSIHQTALYCGMIGSGVIAGYLGETYGWRVPFFVFGGLGLLWALLMYFRLKDGRSDSVPSAAKHVVRNPPLKGLIRVLFKKRSVLSLAVTFGCLVFVNVGYVTWMPTLLHEKFGLSLADAGFSSMFYHVVLAFIGVMVGGKVSDWSVTKVPYGRFILLAIGFLLTAPFVYLMGETNELVFCLIGIAGFGAFRGICDSTFFATLFDVLPNEIRSSGQGVVISFGLLIGSIAPILLGWMKTLWGLSNGIAFMAGVSLLGCIIVVITLFFFAKGDLTRRSDEMEVI